MRKIRIGKRHRPASWWLEPPPRDLCDWDIMRTKQLAGCPRPDRGGAPPRLPGIVGSMENEPLLPSLHPLLAGQ
jgi:hypothetical protein